MFRNDYGGASSFRPAFSHPFLPSPFYLPFYSSPPFLLSPPPKIRLWSLESAVRKLTLQPGSLSCSSDAYMGVDNGVAPRVFGYGGGRWPHHGVSIYANYTL